MAYNSKYTGAEVDNALSKALTAIQEHQDISGKQDVISDLAEIRANSKKGATALQSVPSEYVTETELSNKGYATSSSLESGLSSKVDKVTGKQLSTEDFTTALKNKLSALNNYDDTAINSAISKLRTDFDTLVSGDTTTAIKSFNEIIAFLDGISDSEDLEGIIASIEQQISLKQDKISDLDNIRSGAAKGATALQSYTEKYTGTYSKPSGGIPKTDLATAVQTSLGKADTALQSIPSEYITESELNAKGYTTNVGTITGIKMNGTSKGTSGVVDLGTVITSHQDISGKVDKVSGKGLSTNDYTTTEKTKLGYTNIAYGTCDTAAATAEKAITISGNTNWDLQVGSIIVVKFTNSNTAQNPTFNVNGKGGKPVWYNTSIITTSSLSYAGYKNRAMEFMYDGTQFVFIGWSVDSNSTYSTYSLGIGYGTCDTAASTVAKVVTLSNYSLVVGGIVSVKFTYDVPANATMNINSKGAKSIYHKGAAITSGVIKAGDTATFIYSTYYYLIAIDRATSTATTTTDGLMSSSDKTKLEGVATTYATKTEVNNKQDKVLKFTNKSASTWISDSTYSSFPYRCDISCSGVTSDMFAEVVFNIDESTSGYYAPLCETKSNIVSIWSSVNESITIPTIIITK